LRPLIPAPANAVNLIVQIQSERVNAAWLNPLSGERIAFFLLESSALPASWLGGEGELSYLASSLAAFEI
jgi:hypothetical protein